jgi:hypothetical protein
MWDDKEQYAFDCGYLEGRINTSMNIELDRPICVPSECCCAKEICQHCLRNDLIHDCFTRKTEPKIVYPVRRGS